jgi:transglutaminase-like putative cysteine protease
VENLPDDALGYLLGSRYCETDHLSSLAWNLFGHMPAGWARVQAIVDYVHNRLSFGYGYARSTRTAAQAHEERVGVCRDFAHLAITLCRCMNIPARYVNGTSATSVSPRIPRRWISPPGWKSSSTASGTRSTRATTSSVSVVW